MRLETLNRMLQSPEDMKYRRVYDKIRSDALTGSMSSKFQKLPENSVDEIGRKYIDDKVVKHLQEKGYTVVETGYGYIVHGWDKAPHMRCSITGNYMKTRVPGEHDV